MPNTFPRGGREGGACTNCKSGRLRDTGASWSENGEIKVLYACDACGKTETRNPEPKDAE